MAEGGVCHVPASLPPRSPDTQAGWTPGSVSTSFSDGVNLSFWANYILYSLLPNTNILTPHLTTARSRTFGLKPVLHCKNYVPHHSAANYNTDNCVIQTCVYDYYYAALVWHSVHLWRQKMATSPCWEKLWSNKIFTFSKCHRVTPQLQLTNTYHVISNMYYHILSAHTFSYTGQIRLSGTTG